MHVMCTGASKTLANGVSVSWFLLACLLYNSLACSRFTILSY